MSTLNRAMTVPARYVGCTFETWKGVVPKDLDKWQGLPSTVLIYGGVGTGKTHLATAVFHRLSQSDDRGSMKLWFDAGLLLELAKARFDARHEEAHTPWRVIQERILDSSLVLIDDLAAEHQTDWSVSFLSLLIRHRHNYCLPTLITTNLGPDGLARWDARIHSRLTGFESLAVGLAGCDRRTVRTVPKDSGAAR